MNSFLKFLLLALVVAVCGVGWGIEASRAANRLPEVFPQQKTSAFRPAANREQRKQRQRPFRGMLL